MRDEQEDKYYHGGLGAANFRRDFDRDTRDGDFGRDYQNRYRNGNNAQDFRDRRDFDTHRFENYPSRDHDMEDNYYSHSRRRSHDLDDIRQGYGYSSFGSSAGPEHHRREGMERERRAQQGYGTGRMGGYSGSAFGGANYSAHGSFGGAPEYGAMSGGGGNARHDVSSSGYGGGHSNASMHPDRSTHTDRGEPNYLGNDRNPRERQSYWGRGSGRTDRGGYRNEDPNW
ncbi:hypothetical protein [Pontibacter mangrovi]|uniref:Uncharacterized protein n=1 Tax=Pontibacter mangrovi TaxID=2589816 RepID=A0A501WD26_9BACT|nr:hypothetical protein [Pontibacter mangrovi]TPE46385.1 hypothetical protein FJM65_03320 [Pontibacter mangrovi]